MAKIIEKKYSDDDLSFVVDYLVENEEYTTFKDKILEQLASNVEVKGFRKGKAPVEKAIKQIDQNVLLTTVIKETVDKYSPEIIKEIQDQLKKDERMVVRYDLDYHPEYTGETDKGEFRFRLVATIFPKIDLSKIEKLKIKEPSDKDIEDLPAYSEFEKEEISKLLKDQNSYESTDKKAKNGFQLVVSMEGELDGKKVDNLKAEEFTVSLGSAMFLPEFEKALTGLKKGDKKTFDLPFPADYSAQELAGKTAQVSVEVKEVKEPKYSKIEELIADSEELKKHYKDEKALKDDIKKVYEDKKENIVSNIRKKRVIDVTLSEIEDFAVNEELLKSESERIFGLLEEDTKNKSITIAEAFIKSNLPGSEAKGVSKYNSDKVKKALEEYVKKELKLTQILAYIYEAKVENKPSEKELEEYIKSVKQNPEQFQIPKDANEEQVKNTVNDRIVRQLAGNWLIDTIVKNSSPKKSKESK